MHVHFWKDRWLHSGMILWDLTIAPVHSEDEDVVVADYIDEAKGWKVDRFQHILPSWVLAEILGS